MTAVELTLTGHCSCQASRRLVAGHCRPATVPGGMGTTGAKRCRHQIPLPHAALTVPAPIFRLLLPLLPHGLSPSQALSPSISKTGLSVPCADSFFTQPDHFSSKRAQTGSCRPAANLLLASLRCYHRLESLQNLGSADL